MANKISKSTAYIIDLLCEGEIEGPANSVLGTPDWAASTYFNETPVRNSDGSYNYDGTTITGRVGTATDANYLNDFNSGDMLQAETIVNVELTNAGGSTSRSITDDEVDHCAVTFAFPQGLLVAHDSGKQYGLHVAIKITMTPTNGVETTLVEETIEKKARSEFRQQFVLKNLSSYFDGNDTFPVVIKCYRMTADRTSNSESTYIDQCNWYSFTEIKEVKIQYRNRAVVATELLAEDFGDNIPNRAWKVKLLKIKYPENYTPLTGYYPGAYSGVWDGDFAVGYCTNPAWVVYDILTNTRYGLGIAEDKVDKWTLYAIGQYCDGEVTYKVDVRQSDGTYVQSDVVQKRFTFNGIISDREQALAVINHYCSVFRGFPMWSSGLVTFAQDSPASISRIASPANVKDGVFEYEGTSKRQRTTAVKVGYNDPSNFGKRDTIVLEDTAGIVQYGYNPFDFFAIGCNNRNEAILRGKLALYTNINQTELCSFIGGLEWADALPGDVIGVQDPDYAGETWSGRIVSSTTTSITIDAPVTIANAVTYTLYVQQAGANVTTKTLTNSAGSTSTLTWSGAITAPAAGLVWVISSTSLAIRKFRIMSVKEIETNEFQVSTYEYDPNKYSLVEAGLVIEAPIPTTQPIGELDPPSNLTVESYSYVDGDSGNRKYGMLIDWTASPDARTQYYELKYTKDDGGRLDLDVTGDNSYDWKDVLDGTYDIYLRAKSLTSVSSWVTYADFVMSNDVGTIAPPTGLQVKGGGYEWTGKDCTIEWTAVNEGTYEGTTVTRGVVQNYKVEVYDTDTLTLRRTYFTASKEEVEYTYFYADNVNDGNGIPERDLTFKVYSNSWYNVLSTAATHAMTNPAPDMSSSTPTVTAKPTYLKVSWTPVSDLDMAYYKIFCDTSNPPTTFVGTVNHPDNILEVFGLNYGTDYYVQVEPYDGFGPGDKSVIPGAVSPLQVPGANVDVDVELADSITMTDSDDNTAEDLAELYNKTYASGGVAYTLTGTDKYIQYAYNIENYFDRVGVWCSSASTRVYVATSVDGSTWSFLKAEADHTLDSNFSLLTASNVGDAQTNYWQLAAGKNIALFPNNISAKYVRLWLRGTYTTTIYEYVPSRLLIAELAAIDSLSAISADIGTVSAGNLQSSDYGASAGINIDLDAKTVNLGGSSAPVLKFYNDGSNKLEINAKVTFASSSSGYSNITDKPDSLADISATEGSKLSGVEAGATAGATWGTNVTNQPGDSTILNSYNQSGPNLCPYANFDLGITGWAQTLNGLTGIVAGTDYATDWRLKQNDGSTLYVYQPNIAGNAAYYVDYYSGRIAVDSTKRYCVSAYTGAHRCTVKVYVVYFTAADATNNWTSGPASATNASEASGGQLLSGYKRIYDFFTPPANTSYCRIYLRKYDTTAGQTNSYLFACRVMLSEVGSAQTTVPAWGSYGTDVSGWQHPSNVTKIDGGDLYVGSQITLNEGGKAVFGNQNVIIDTAGSHGSIIVAPDGGPTSKSYCQLNNDDILFYYWNGGGHQLYNSMTRVESGTASANTYVTLPGIWKQQPKIIISPNSLQSYHVSYANQSQTLQCSATNITATGLTYYFYTTAQLILSAGAVGVSFNELATRNTAVDWQHNTRTLATNTRSIVVSSNANGYYWSSTAMYNTINEVAVFSHYEAYYKHAIYGVCLYYYLAGVGWQTTAWQYNINNSGYPYNYTTSFTFNVGTQAQDIQYYFLYYDLIGWDSAITEVVNTGSTNPGNGYYLSMTDIGYTSNLVGATALATGTVNWVALGR